MESEGPPSAESDLIAKGHLTLPDVSSTVDNHLYEVSLAWKKTAKDPWVEKVRDFGEKDIVEAVRGSVKSFVEDFNAHYC